MAKVNAITNIVGFFNRTKDKGNPTTKNLLVNTEVLSEGDRGSKSQRTLESICGFEYFGTTNKTGFCRGAFQTSNGEKFYCIGNKVYNLFETSKILAYCFDVSDSNHEVTFTETSGYGSTEPYLVVADGLNVIAYNYANAEPKAVAIELPKRPNGNSITPCDIGYIYQHLVVLDEGSDAFYTSIFQPFATKDGDGNLIFDVFTAGVLGNGYLTYAEATNDIIRKLVVLGSNIVAIGSHTTQVFNYNNIAVSSVVPVGSVWTSPVSSGVFNIGCEQPRSVQILNGSIYFVCNTKDGAIGVAKFGNGGFSLVSTQAIETYLVGNSVIRSLAFIWNQHPLYCFGIGGSKCFAYDERENGFIELDTFGARYSNVLPFGGKFLLTEFANGFTKLVVTNKDEIVNADGSLIEAVRCGNIFSASNDHVLISSVGLEAESEENRAVDFNLRWKVEGTMDNFASYLTAGKKFYDLGEGKKWSIEVSTTSNVPFKLNDCTIECETCIY